MGNIIDNFKTFDMESFIVKTFCVENSVRIVASDNLNFLIFNMEYKQVTSMLICFSYLIDPYYRHIR